MRAKTKQKNNSLKCEQIYAQPAPNNHVSGLNDHGLNWNFKKRSMTLLAASGGFVIRWAEILIQNNIL